jgi:hypothetical protein
LQLKNTHQLYQKHHSTGTDLKVLKPPCYYNLGATKCGRSSISEAAYEKVKESFNCRSIGQVSLKNKQNPVSVYEVLD